MARFGWAALAAFFIACGFGPALAEECKVDTTVPTLVSGNTTPLRCDVNGRLIVSSAVGGGTSSNFGAAFPTAGTAIGVKDSTLTNLTFLKADASNNLSVAVVSTPETAAFAAFGSPIPTAGFAAGFSDGTNLQTPRVYDQDTGAGVENVLGVTLRRSAGGSSVELGTFTNPIRTDPNGTTTQPVSAASLPLPTGAATSANQATAAAQGSTTSGQTGPLVQGAVTTAAPTYTTAQTSPLSLTTGGLLRVDASGTVPAVSQSGTWRFGSVSNFYTGVLGSVATYSGTSANAKAIGGLQTITNAVASTNGGGVLTYVSVFMRGGQTNPITIYLFRANPTSSTCSDNTNFALNSADENKLIHIPITITPQAMPGITPTMSSFTVPFDVKNGDATTSLYLCPVVSSTMTLSAASLMVSLGIDQYQ